VIPFAIQVIAVSGVVGFFSFKNGERAIENLATQLLDEVGDHITDRIAGFLLDATELVDQNQDILASNLLAVDNLQAWSSYLWYKGQGYDFVSNLVVANPQGQLIGSGTLVNREGTLTQVIGFSSVESNYNIEAHTSLDRALARTKPDLVAPSTDPRLRPFYQVGINSTSPRWTAIHPGFDAAQSPNWVLALTQPLFGNNSPDPIAVSAIFLRLSHISTFLQSLEIGKSGQVLIVEQSGELVASSLDEDLFTRTGGSTDGSPNGSPNGSMERITAQQSQDAITQAIAPILASQPHNQVQNLQVDLNQQPYYLRLIPFQDPKGLDWLIVIAVPESDFMAEIHRNTRITWAVSLVALGGTIALGMVSARWITRPIQRVSNAAQEIALGHLDRRVNSSGIEELKVLGGAFNQMAQQLQQSFHALEEANLNLEVTVKQRTAQLELEKEKSERLLLNILPDVIAQQLKQGSVLIANYSEEVSILFADIVGFTLLASQISPIDLVKLLNHIFSTFDELAETFKLEKIKTIGDAYMVVAGLPVSRSDHAEAVANMALAMQDCMDDLTVKLGYKLQLRIGINTGVVVAGVIGIKKFNYDLWGDAVNVASRMESSGEPARIQVTQDTYDRIHPLYHLESRGPIMIKGKGTMETYWLLGKKG